MFWRLHLLLVRAELEQRIVFKYRQCVRLFNLALRSRHRWVLPDSLLRLSHIPLMQSAQAKADGRDEAAAVLMSHSFEICKLAATCAAEAGDEQRIVQAAGAAAILEGEEPGNWSVALIATIKDPAVRREADEWLGRIRRRRAGEQFPTDVQTSEVQIYKQMADALGISVDGKDQLSRLVRIGLDDLNPERVLRSCEYLFISLGSHGLVAEWLGLPTAGAKYIHCLKHGHNVGCMSLDAGFLGPLGFQERHCATCGDRSPRPESWRWSEEWQQGENERNRTFLEGFNPPI